MPLLFLEVITTVLCIYCFVKSEKVFEIGSED